jgi:hypothetical protein
MIQPFIFLGIGTVSIGCVGRMPWFNSLIRHFPSSNCHQIGGLMIRIIHPFSDNPISSINCLNHNFIAWFMKFESYLPIEKTGPWFIMTPTYHDLSHWFPSTPLAPRCHRKRHSAALGAPFAAEKAPAPPSSASLGLRHLKPRLELNLQRPQSQVSRGFRGYDMTDMVESHF